MLLLDINYITHFTDDGPLQQRIFIDTFQPSLEGNRIFPLFNFRCVEKIERNSKDFYEKKRNRKLGVVSSEERRYSLIVESEETQNVALVGGRGEDENVEKLKKVTELGEEESEKVDQLRKTDERRDVTAVKETKKLDKMDRIEEGHEKVTQTIVDRQGVQRVDEKRNIASEKAQEVQGKAKVEVQEQQVSNTKGKQGGQGVGATKQGAGATKQETGTATQVTGAATKGTATTEQGAGGCNRSEADSKPGERKTDSSAKDDKSSTIDDQLMKKILRTLMENQELVDFFCEKVISKIAQRNDFCGPNCGSTCGGLNKPSEK